MDWPTTLDGLTPAFLTEVLGHQVTAVSRSPLGAPWTSLVEALEVSLVDGRTEHLVAKVARPGRVDPLLYRQEVGFYRAVSERVDCAPRARFAECHRDGRFLLILDHAPGRHLPDGFDEATAKAALTCACQSSTPEIEA
jgi:hypothetical protein